ncbi:MAG: hypothetical protein IJT41_04390 [Clostridia bacterium]|nr:hypothetical protein [Clostridia bacterium]
MTDDSNSFALEFRLRDLDRDLHTRFTDCVFVLQKVLSNYKLLFPEYTDHSELHSLTVIDFCNTLIGKQLDRLNKNEIYVLLCSCYFHDTGMGITKKDYEAFSRVIDFGDYFEKHPNASVSEQIRDFHNEYSGLFIRKYAELFEFPSQAHLEAIIQISRGHRKTDLMDENVYPIELPTPDGETICLPYLAAMIRLADEIDVTAARSSKLLYDLEAITDEHQLFEHKRHRAVRDLIIGRDSFTLMIDDSDPVINEMITRMADKMQRTLDSCRDAVNGRTPFEITQSRIVLCPI